MKTISVVVPCHNEEGDVGAMALAMKEIFVRGLPDHGYELIFISNDSKDDTREIIRCLCGEDGRVKGIFNAKSLGQFSSPYYGMLQSTEGCTVLVACDFQDPMETISQFVEEQENGYKIVTGIKNSNQESRIMYQLRGCCYKVIKKLSDAEQIEQFTGFGLCDVRFVDVLHQLDDPVSFLRGIVVELGFRRKEISYEQPKQEAGKTSDSFCRLHDAAMLSVTSYTKVGLCMATIFGSSCSAVSMVVTIAYLVMKLIYWDYSLADMAPLLIGMCFLGPTRIFSIGLAGEYIPSINSRAMKRSLVVEEERINFDNEDEGGEI